MKTIKKLFSMILVIAMMMVMVGAPVSAEDEAAAIVPVVVASPEEAALAEAPQTVEENSDVPGENDSPTEPADETVDVGVDDGGLVSAAALVEEEVEAGEGSVNAAALDNADGDDETGAADGTEVIDETPATAPVQDETEVGLGEPEAVEGSFDEGEDLTIVDDGAAKTETEPEEEDEYDVIVSDFQLPYTGFAYTLGDLQELVNKFAVAMNLTTGDTYDCSLVSIDLESMTDVATYNVVGQFKASDDNNEQILFGGASTVSKEFKVRIVQLVAADINRSFVATKPTYKYQDTPIDASEAGSVFGIRFKGAKLNKTVYSGNTVPVDTNDITYTIRNAAGEEIEAIKGSGKYKITATCKVSENPYGIPVGLAIKSGPISVTVTSDKFNAEYAEENVVASLTPETAIRKYTGASYDFSKIFSLTAEYEGASLNLADVAYTLKAGERSYPADTVLQPGDYTVTATAEIVDARFESGITVSDTSTFSVIEQDTDEIFVRLSPESASFVYDGEAIALEEIGLTVITESDNIVIGEPASYTITKDGVQVDGIKDVGEYVITASGAVDGAMYVSTPCTVTVEKLEVVYTIKSDADSLADYQKTYGADDPIGWEKNYEVSGIGEGDISAALNREIGQAVLTYGNNSNANESGYAISLENVSENIDASFENPDDIRFVINKLPVTYTLKGDYDYSKYAYADDPAYGAAYDAAYEDGIIAEANEAAVADAIDDAVIYRASWGVEENVGVYDLALTDVNDNIKATFDGTGKFEIKALPVEVILSDEFSFEKVYGADDPDFSKEYEIKLPNGFSASTLIDGLSKACDAAISGIEVVRAEGEDVVDGGYALSLKNSADNTNIDAVLVNENNTAFEILPLEVSYALDSEFDFSKVYGETDPVGFDKAYVYTATAGINDSAVLEAIEAAVLTREAGEEVKEGNYSIFLTNDNKNIKAIFDDAEGEFEILPLQVSYKLKEGYAYEKAFAQNDPEDLASAYEWEYSIEGAYADGITDEVIIAEISKAVLSREAGEDVATYALKLTAGDAETEILADDPQDVGNLSVVLAGDIGSFEIKAPVITVSDIDTRTSSFTYAISLPEEDVNEEFLGNVGVTATYAFPEGVEVNLADGNVAAPIVGVQNENGTWTFTVPEIAYSKEGNDWNGYLPAGTTIEFTAAIAGDTAVSALNLVVDANGADATVSAAEITLNVAATLGSYAISGGEGDNAVSGEALNNGASLVITNSGKTLAGEFVKVTLPAKGETAAAVKYLVFDEEGKITVSNEELHAHLDDSSFVPDAKLLSTISVVLLDAENLVTEEVSNGYVFDIGVQPAVSASYNTRDKQISFVLGEEAGTELAVKVDDVVVGNVTIAGGTNYGPIDFNEWMTAEKLFTASSRVYISYNDKAGNAAVSADFGIGKTSVPYEGLKAASIYVRPEPVQDTIGKDAGVSLRIYGKGVAREALIVNVNGRSYEVDVSGSGAYAHANIGDWSIRVNLEEIDFPVDIPVDVTVSYRDIADGEASVTLVYKNWAMPVVVSSPAMQNQSVIYGFAEEGSAVTITVNGKQYSSNDGTGMMEMGEDGYYILSLMNPLVAGDEVTIVHTDFAGNESEAYSFIVPGVFDGKTFAQPMGKNIVGRYEVGEGEWKSAHRFATPFDVDEMREAAENGEKTSFEVPVLAFGGYEVGKMTFTYQDNKLVLTPNINSSFLYEGAESRMSIYSSTPEIDDLVLLTHANTAFASVDLTDITGTIYVYVEFDVEMDQTTIANGIGFISFTEDALEFLGGDIGDLYRKFQKQ